MKKGVIGEAKPHTIKKFELVEKYVDGWARRILAYDKSDGLMFIDCMCNCGIYKDIAGNMVEGTALRVAKLLNKMSVNYTKHIKLYFNDIEEEKIKILKRKIESLKLNNIDIEYSSKDANIFLKEFNLKKTDNYNFLLFYDPYNASIDWEAVSPFLNIWGEVILNHMVSDTTRAINVVSDKEKIKRYEKTYCCEYETLKSIGSDRKKYECIIRDIIKNRSKRAYYLASFPFYIRTNAVVYDLIYFSHNLEGFKLFKNVAWKTFDGKFSSKVDNKGILPGQFSFEFFEESTEEEVDSDSVYTIEDIAKYIYDKYRNKGIIRKESIYRDLDMHPIFPGEGYRKEICRILNRRYNVKVGQKTIEL